MSTLNRVATASMYDNSIRNIGARQNSLVEQNEKMTAGKRVLRASDDPVAAAQAERAITRMERIKVEQQALDLQRNAVAQSESSMGDAINLMQNMRELMVHAGDGTHSPQDRRIIARQIEGLREQLLTVANRKDTNGLPLLGALGSALEPFLGTSAPNGFAGLAGQASGSAVNIPTMLDGDSAFMFQTGRDGAYHAGISNAGAPPTPLNGRHFGSSEVSVDDASQITVDANGKGDDYEIVFTSVVPGSSSRTSTATYEIRNKTTGGAALTGTVTDFPNDKPLSLEISQAATPGAFVPGLKLTINATTTTAPDGTITRSPAVGDTVTLSPLTSIFGALDQTISDITNATNANAATQAVGQGLANLDRGLERLQSMRSYAGELLNRADRITGDQDVRSIQLEGDRSRAEDLDMVQGISDFQQTQVGYQAALQSYAMVQKLSMFNYIS